MTAPTLAAPVSPALARRLAEAVGHATDAAADRRVEDADIAVVRGVAEQVALGFEHEAGALEIGADDRRVHAVRRLHLLARVPAGRADMIDHRDAAGSGARRRRPDLLPSSHAVTEITRGTRSIR